MREAEGEDSLSSEMSTGHSGEFWDPFEETVYVIDGPELQATPRFNVPKPFVKLAAIMPIFAIILFIFLFSMAESQSHLLFIIAIMIPAVIFYAIAIPKYAGEDERKLRSIKACANKLDFAMRSDIAQDRRVALVKRVSSFFKMKFGASLSISVRYELWGCSEYGKIPFWMGLDLINTASFFGGPKNEIKGKKGRVVGQLLTFVVGYELTRDTRVRVEIFPEFKTPLGPLDIDIKTESVEFNKIYNIRLNSEDGQAAAQEMSASLLQVLTPAFQSTLIDLADKYAARIIIDDNAVFFAGSHNIVSSEQDELDALIEQTIASLMTAATSFKQYVE